MSEGLGLSLAIVNGLSEYLTSRSRALNEGQPLVAIAACLPLILSLAAFVEGDDDKDVNGDEGGLGRVC